MLNIFIYIFKLMHLIRFVLKYILFDMLHFKSCYGSQIIKYLLLTIYSFAH